MTSPRLSRYDCREIIRNIKLKTSGKAGSRASGPLQKAILRELAAYAEKHGLCFPSLETLAQCTGYSTRSIQNGLDALEAQKFIVRSKRERTNNKGGLSNQYSIVWDELSSRANELASELTVDQVATVASCSDQRAVSANQPATSSDQVAIVVEQVAIASDQKAVVATEDRRENRRKKTKEETITEGEWVVVDLLKSLGVDLAQQAFDDAIERGAILDDIRADIEYYQGRPVSEQIPAHLKRWVAMGSCPRDKSQVIASEHRLRIEQAKRQKLRDSYEYQARIEIPHLMRQKVNRDLTPSELDLVEINVQRALANYDAKHSLPDRVG